MNKTFLSLIAGAFVVTAFAASPAWAQKGHGGGGGARPGFSGGARPAGGFSAARPAGVSAVRPAGVSAAYHYNNNHGYNYNHGYNNYNHGYNYGALAHNYYRPYYANRAYLSFYLPYYGYNNYAPYYYASYVPYYGGLGLPYYPLGYSGSYAPSVAAAQPPPQDQSERPRDGAAHLQLTVPENAEVLIDGIATTQTGTTREFVTPQLSPGSRYVYKITVRTRDAKGQVVDDTRDIRFQADDWFGIDFTRPAPPPGPSPGSPLTPLPRPKTTKDE